MEFDMPKGTTSIIKVIGVGGGGSNAVNHMYEQELRGVDFIVCNTDRQALDISPVPYKIQLGPSLTEGRGAGSIPEIGRNAAVENIEDIRNLLAGTKMVFVTAGMGGGTGTGAAPVIAQVAKELNILTVGIVTVPFAFEGRRRRQQAEEGLEVMRQCVDTLLVINNERLLEFGSKMPLSQSFAMADNVLATAAKGIADVITTTGAINVDFNDVNTVMRNSGVAIMGSCAFEGENRAIEAVKGALNSPLLNDNNIEGATYILMNITYGDMEVTMDEIGEITDFIQDEAGSSADVIWGHGYDPSLGNKLSVTLIATGFSSSPVTGFEKAPEKKVEVLEDKPKNEIKSPLVTPTTNNAVSTTVEDVKVDEPFLKEEVKNEPVAQTSSFEFDFVVKEEVTALSNPTNSTSVETKEEPVRLFLEDEVEAKVDLENVMNKAPMSAEELNRRNAERMERFNNYNNKIKKSEGLKELENEPAFVRRNIHLDQVVKSEESTKSRFGLTDDGLKTNNSFLHDNVD
jgi:cell division protein FtsZ